MKDLELFHFHLERAIYIFKFQDKKLVETWVHQLHISLDSDYVESCLTAAILELSTTDTKTFHWVLDNLSDWKPCSNLLEAVTRFALQKLIQKGFIPGQEFSFTANGRILLSESVKKAIIRDTAKTDTLLLEKVLLTTTQIYSLTT